MSYAKHLTDKVTGLDKVQLRTDGGATADVYLHGAHVTSFKPSGGQEVIFVSKQAVYKPPKAIRGGIPVCWPQFNDMGPGTSHGFARNSAFEVACLSGSKVELRLSSNQDTKERFPHDFELRVTVEVTDAKGGTLHQTMEVDNKSADKMRTTHALHTYYRVSDIDNVSVSHLGSTEYLDNADERKAKSHAEAAARIDGVSLVDRIYKTQGRSVRIEDTGSPGRRIVVDSEGFDDIVLWNPGPDAAKAMADLGDDEFRSMVCVEPANAALYMDGRAIEVAAGETWCASQQIHVEAL